MKYSATACISPKCVFSVVERLIVNKYYCCHCKQKTRKTYWADGTIFIIKVYIKLSSILRQNLSLWRVLRKLGSEQVWAAVIWQAY